MFAAVARALLLASSRNASLNRFALTHGGRLGARRFVAGESLDAFVPVVRELNAAGFTVASGILGEGVSTEAETEAVCAEYRTLLDRIADERLGANVALKLTHLGLAIDEGLALRNVRGLVEYAAERGIFVRMDMEESACVEPTLHIYRTMRSIGVDNTGVVLQAYLYRAMGDLEALLAVRPNVRLVKGAYLESAAVAFPRKRDVDRNYKALIERALAADGFTAIATHDEDAIRHTIEFARSHGIAARGRFEFQMLYGVRPALQRRLIAEEYPVRVAAPFGGSWFPYFMRRLAERPANVAFILGSMLRR
ncbi:MAG: proline dehydrogenase family protein [Candidatus Eremiobacteraeota bacterium]|nr:proline dehydrogenase family protein [Candidatus Eremiobacteraeota bacterium]